MISLQVELRGNGSRFLQQMESKARRKLRGCRKMRTVFDLKMRTVFDLNSNLPAIIADCPSLQSRARLPYGCPAACKGVQAFVKNVATRGI